MPNYTEFTQWSVIHDSMIARVSMTDNHGREFFAILPDYGERGYKERKAEALDALAYAIESGMQPGEVRWQPTQQTRQLAD